MLRRTGWGSALALAVALVWNALAVQAFARSLPVANCGCFGVHLAQRLRWWTVLEDAAFVAGVIRVRSAAAGGTRPAAGGRKVTPIALTRPPPTSLGRQ